MYRRGKEADQVVQPSNPGNLGNCCNCHSVPVNEDFGAFNRVALTHAVELWWIP